MKSKEEIINEMFNECGGNIFKTTHDVRIVSSHMERYAIEKQIEVLEEVNRINNEVNTAFRRYMKINNYTVSKLTELKKSL